MKMKRTRLNIILTLLLVFMMVPVNAFAGYSIAAVSDISGMDLDDEEFTWNAVEDATTYTVVLNDYESKNATSSTQVGTFTVNNGVFDIEDSSVTSKLTRYHYYTITVTAKGIDSTTSEATTLSNPTTSTDKYYYNDSGQVTDDFDVALTIQADDQVTITHNSTNATKFKTKLYKTKYSNVSLDSDGDVRDEGYTYLTSKTVSISSDSTTTVDFDYDEFDYETGSDAENNYFVEVIGTKSSSDSSDAVYSPMAKMFSTSKGTLQTPVFDDGLNENGYVRLDGSNDGLENVETIILQVWEKDGSNTAVKTGSAYEISKNASSSSDISHTFDITRNKDCYYYVSAIYYAPGWDSSAYANSSGFISDVTDDDDDDDDDDSSTTDTSTKLSAPSNLSWSGNRSTWSDVSNADAYQVSKYVDGSQVGPSKIVTNTYITFSGLSKAGNYTFKVRAITYDNDYSNSNTTVSPTKTITGTVAQPGSFKITKAKKTSSSVKLYWSKSANVDVYRIYKKVNGNYKMYIKSVRGTATAKTITGLQSGTAHYFKVKAVNSGLYVYSNAKKATTYSY